MCFIRINRPRTEVVGHRVVSHYRHLANKRVFHHSHWKRSSTKLQGHVTSHWKGNLKIRPEQI